VDLLLKVATVQQTRCCVGCLHRASSPPDLDAVRLVPFWDEPRYYLWGAIPL